MYCKFSAYSLMYTKSSVADDALKICNVVVVVVVVIPGRVYDRAICKFRFLFSLSAPHADKDGRGCTG